ncbi:hypothetical protein PQZ67_gp46 [Escherichia phage ZCEC13]|nr:hypothetical protein PQZ67_gp46 [Escherichia phage ZCEC13]
MRLVTVAVRPIQQVRALKNLQRA